jgi:hypothetical protein
MSFLLNKLLNLIIGGLICIIAGERPSVRLAEEPFPGDYFQQIPDPAEMKGYRDVFFYNGKFIAVGSDGRIDNITNSDERIPVVNACKNNLNCVIGRDKELVVAGDKGTILLSSDAQIFSQAETGTDKNINGIAFINDLLIAGADRGTILISKNGNSWNSMHLEVKGNIVSLTANDSFCIGITDSGEIIRSNDGFNWEITDYNKKYSGYNKSCIFKKILTANNRIVIIGRHDDGSPAVLFSSLGNVWTERSLIYNDDHGIIRFLANTPNDITYDPVRDQFILVCDNGEIFILPSCTKCNLSVIISPYDLFAVTCTNDLLVSAGEGFFVNIINF